MDKVSPRVRKLDKALSSLPLDSDAMMVSQLDGLVAGLLVCPELILPGEWLPLVWGGTGEDGAIFESLDQARQLTAMVIEHYNDVAGALQSDKGYGPIYDVDVRHDETLWEIWIEGFETAMNLRPKAWLDIVNHGDADATAAIAGMMALGDIARHESELSSEQIDRLTLAAPDLIPEWVMALNAWRLDNHPGLATTVPTPSAKTGRNDPCPCGSGRKYKKCCLN